jgi:hypothetical protein
MRRKPLLALAVLMTTIGAGAVGVQASWGTSVSTSTAPFAGGIGLLPQCSNGVDDDGDGRTDLKDPGCTGPFDDSEYNPPPPQCSNGKDDDGDGLVDLRDPGCSGPQDDNEKNAVPPPPPPPPPPAGHGHLPSELFGLAEGGTADAGDYARMQRINVASMRVTLFWRQVQPVRGRYIWPDQYVAWLASYGIRPSFMVFGAPEWATGSSYSGVPPLKGKAKKAWQKFLEKAVRRYGPHGSFWKKYPGLPKRPVRSWQIWNEPNLAKSFAKNGSWPSVRLVKHAPRAYAHLVKSSDKAISKVDPHAKVVLAGLTSNPKRDSLLPWRFLKKFLKVPQITKHFTAAALHPYAPSVAKFKRLLKRTRRAMKTNGARKKDLWLTEVGWGSAKDKFPLTKGMKGQAKILRKSFKFIVRKRDKLNVSRVFWFYWRDPSPQSGPTGCTFCGSSGLLNYQRSDKPSFRQFKHFTLKQR